MNNLIDTNTKYTTHFYIKDIHKENENYLSIYYLVMDA